MARGSDRAQGVRAALLLLALLAIASAPAFGDIAYGPPANATSSGLPAPPIASGQYIFSLSAECGFGEVAARPLAVSGLG